MTNEELKIKITSIVPSSTFEEGGEWLNAVVESSEWLNLAIQLRNDPELQFDYLFCLTCVDWKTHLTMVYHLRSVALNHTLVVKSKLESNAARIESVATIWRTAEFHEREVYELFGVEFLHHPDLRLLILPDGWEGKNPLRKNYEDEVNMIRL
jgi:NADH-quinone oxidoreductase subunit C